MADVATWSLEAGVHRHRAFARAETDRSGRCCRGWALPSKDIGTIGSASGKSIVCERVADQGGFGELNA